MLAKLWQEILKRPLEPSSRIWKDNIEMVTKETGCGSVDWSYLTQHRNQQQPLVNTAMNIRDE